MNVRIVNVKIVTVRGYSMNNFKNIVLNWGLKLGIIGVLAITMCSVANGQVEVQRMKRS